MDTSNTLHIFIRVYTCGRVFPHIISLIVDADSPASLARDDMVSPSLSLYLLICFKILSHTFSGSYLINMLLPLSIF